MVRSTTNIAKTNSWHKFGLHWRLPRDVTTGTKQSYLILATVLGLKPRVQTKLNYLWNTTKCQTAGYDIPFIQSINNIYFIQMPNGILSNVDLFNHSWQREEISTTGCGCWLIRLSTVEILCGFVLCTWDKSFLYRTTWRHNSHKIYAEIKIKLI